jgi:hypothetical protein
MVNVEKQVSDPGVGLRDVAEQLKRVAQQTDLGAGDGEVEEPGKGPGFVPVKPGFSRVAGSFRRQVPPHAVRDLGE